MRKNTVLILMSLVYSLSVVGIAAAEDKKPVSIKGKVVLDAKPKKPKKIKPGVDAYCEKVHESKPIIDQTIEVTRKGELANIFVYVDEDSLDKKEWPTPKEPVVLDQKGCRYIPHVFGIMAGQKLEIVNSDRTNHNVHLMPKKNKEENFSQPKANMKKLIELAKPETFMIKCDVHAWMNTWCHVMTHPFYATTDTKGEFEIKGLPDGEYELIFWHESGSEAKEKVKVEDGKATDLGEIKFKIEKKKKRR